MYDYTELFENISYFCKSVQQVNEFWYNAIVSSYKDLLKL